MKAVEIRELSVEDLKSKIEEMTAQQRNLKLGHAVTQLENPLQLRSNRKVIARLKTELNGRLKAAQ